MTAEEKRAWIMVVVTIGAYGAYIAIILERVKDMQFAKVPYISPMIESIVAAIIASIVLNILIAIFSPKDADKKDQRDREIHQFGEYIGQSFLVIGGVAVLFMSWTELEYFWIANVMYLAFGLSAIVGSTAKIIAYRQGFQKW